MRGWNHLSKHLNFFYMMEIKQCCSVSLEPVFCAVYREPVDEVLQMPPSLLTCGGCQQSIGDRFFLKAIEQYWHEDCLSCDLCGCRLGEVGRRLYYKLGRKLCRRDYLRWVYDSPRHDLFITYLCKDYVFRMSSLLSVTALIDQLPIFLFFVFSQTLSLVIREVLQTVSHM